jgi:hypothetical protein
MAQETFTREEIEKSAFNLNRPIPGQSLTNDPENPAPYEKPPKFTSKEDAIEHFAGIITDEDNYANIIQALVEGVDVMSIVELLLTQSFKKGEINPDMMLILAEPLAYLLIGLAEREGVNATIVDDPDDPEDFLDPQQDINPSVFRNQLNKIKEPKADEEFNLDERIKSAPSLMDREG